MRSIRRSRSRHVRPTQCLNADLFLESLEPRIAMSANFGNTIRNQYALADPAAEIRYSLREDDFQAKPRGGQVLLGLQTHDAGTGFLPGSIRVRAVRGNAIGLVAGPNRTLLRYKPGTATQVYVAARSNEAARFALETWLVGDADGNGKVDQADLNAIRASQGQKTGDSDYRIEADSDRDGRITVRDARLARINLGVSTRLQPISFLAHTDRFDDRLLTALTDDGRQIEFLVERDGTGNATRISGIREFGSDGSNRTTMLDNLFRPIAISDNSGVRIGLEWLADGKVRWSAAIPGVEGTVEAVTDGIPVSPLAATKTIAAEAVQRTSTPVADPFPGLDPYGQRPIRVHVTDIADNPVTDATVYIDYRIEGSNDEHVIEASPDPASGPGYYQAVIPFLTERAHERDAYKAIIDFVDDPIMELLPGATCEFLTNMGGLYVLETGIAALAAAAFTRGGTSAATAVMVAGESALVSMVFYCSTMGRQLAGGPYQPGSPSVKDMIGNFVKDRYAQLPNLKTTATATVFYRPDNKPSGMIRSAPFDPRLDKTDWNRVDVSVRIPDEKPPTYMNGVFISPGPVKVATRWGVGNAWGLADAEWEGTIAALWTIYDVRYATLPDGRTVVDSAVISWVFDQPGLPNTKPGTDLDGNPGTGFPLKLTSRYANSLSWGSTDPQSNVDYFSIAHTDFGHLYLKGGVVENGTVRYEVRLATWGGFGQSLEVRSWPLAYIGFTV